MKKLNYYIGKDPRIIKVYKYAKEGYSKANLQQHNFSHVLRCLYRALLIGESEKNVKYEILIPAVLLHDIGFSEGAKEKHAEVSAEVAERELPDFGYGNSEIIEIVHCILSHEDRDMAKTLEAKILIDSDMLEKSGIGGAYTLYRYQQESGISISELIPRIKKKMRRNIEKGFFTAKAKDISGDGFQEYINHLENVEKSLDTRTDFLVTEEDLLDNP